jgi:hypothetical protein
LALPLPVLQNVVSQHEIQAYNFVRSPITMQPGSQEVVHFLSKAHILGFVVEFSVLVVKENRLTWKAIQFIKKKKNNLKWKILKTEHFLKTSSKIRRKNYKIKLQFFYINGQYPKSLLIRCRVGLPQLEHFRCFWKINWGKPNTHSKSARKNTPLSTSVLKGFNVYPKKCKV